MALKLVNKITEKEYAQVLFEIIKQRRELDKKEKELKEHFKKTMESANVSVMKVGDFILALDDRKTTSIDRDKLFDDLGLKAKVYEREILYKVLDIKRAA